MLVMCQYLRHFYKTIKIKLIKEGTTLHQCYCKFSCVGGFSCGDISDEEKEKTLHVINVQVSEALLQYNLDPLIKEGKTLH